ncbi:hypothetical protein FA15DRAFT_169368 [Coprinopsis marcescibilis]|uniref:Uncharacterized protein n=1 Tax=Coprinopsis marcescibilis TaxID=230819 RepID=A0A5C3L455_COPMA|nr:hypothetical protein FA15DRAFT_169368 [Coprinopsis marcescibilis]
MDPRETNNLLEEGVRYRFNGQIPPPRMRARDDTKRQGVYFPSLSSNQPDLNKPLPTPSEEFELEEWNTAKESDGLDDHSSEGSTWEFKALPSSERRSYCSRSPRRSTLRSNLSTAAMEMVARYRAGMPLDMVLSEDCISPSASTRTTRSTMSATSPEQERLGPYDGNPYDENLAKKDLIPYCRQSRADALFQSSTEAHGVMQAQRVSPQDPITCVRPGCKDLLRNVDALARHLHIHNIHDSTIICNLCKNVFETEEELAKHICRRRSRINSFTAIVQEVGSPIKETFARVINKVGSIYGQ